MRTRPRPAVAPTRLLNRKPDTKPKPVRGGAAAKDSAASATARRSRAQIFAAITNAAVEVFAQEGLSGASTQAIAERAGLSKQRLHYYIVSKEDLYSQILQDVMADWIGVFGLSDEARGPRQVLGEYIRRKLVFSFEQPLRSRIFAMEIMRGAPILRPMMSTSRRRTLQAVAVIENWIDQGLMERVDPLLLLFSIWSVTQFYAEHAEQVRYFTDRQSIDGPLRESILAQTIQFILRGAGVK